jgi:hypothetical protein
MQQHNSVETCRRGVIICQIIVYLLVIVQNKLRKLNFQTGSYCFSERAVLSFIQTESVNMLCQGTTLSLICTMRSCMRVTCSLSSPARSAQCRLDRRGFQIGFRIQLPFELYIIIEVWHPRKLPLNVRRYSVVMFMVHFATLSVFSLDR